MNVRSAADVEKKDPAVPQEKKAFNNTFGNISRRTGVDFQLVDGHNKQNWSFDA